MSRQHIAHRVLWALGCLIAGPACDPLFGGSQCNNIDELWCVGDVIHKCLDTSGGDGWGPDRSDIEMGHCDPGMCVSWKDADKKSKADCLLTKDPCPPALQQICVGNQLAECTPNRQAVPAYHSYRDGDYCMVSPVDGEAYWVFQYGTCAPDGISSECEAQCDSSQIPFMCGQGSQLVCAKGLWLSQVDGCLVSCLPADDTAICVNDASLACQSNTAPFCALGKSFTCQQTADGWQYDTVDCWGELLDYDFVGYGHECVDLGAGKKPTCAFSEEACAPEGATKCASSSDGQRSGYLICRGQLWAEEILCPTGCLDDTLGAHCL
jgi:hypothetical protein